MRWSARLGRVAELLRTSSGAHLVPDPSARDAQFYRLLVAQLVDPFSLWVLLTECVDLIGVLLDPFGALAQESGQLLLGCGEADRWQRRARHQAQAWEEPGGEAVRLCEAEGAGCGS